MSDGFGMGSVRRVYRADVSGGVCGPEADANRHVYGSTTTARHVTDGVGSRLLSTRRNFWRPCNRNSVL